MANLIYSAIASLDGFTADDTGDFDWAAPDEEVLAFVNDRERPVGTYLCGRRMYQTMIYWETASIGEDEPAVVRDYARIWQAAEKVVYSSTLDAASSARTRLEREFAPDAVRRLKEAAGRDVTVRGPQLAAQALAAGLVDECHLLLNPVVVSGGTRALPAGLHLELELLDERRFGNGVVYLRYRVG
ncbi:dihydrofolate reductase family protein [Dactylosporangium sp. NPDC049140]|jgi:dihydrofolate reductase|uniref:dihydrofolate reductase family protein n=1 Tax=Dactylosporangium sp. NPDC049140 TaxID=3155647 RepID=UPI0033E10E6A